MKHKNIVLTGIMGCGKTTLGRLISDTLGIGWIDLDHYIESKWGRITELFRFGESYFRDLESQAILEVSEKEDVVIATGGGAVLKKENVLALKKSGLVFFIDRPLQQILFDIETAERPLIKNGKENLIKIYNDRYPVYIKTCDVHIRNTGDIQSAAKEIMKYWCKANRYPDTYHPHLP